MTRRSLFAAPLALLVGLLPVKRPSLSNGFYRFAVGHVYPSDGFYVPPSFASEMLAAIKPEVLTALTKEKV